MVNERGTKKWTSLMLPEHVKMLGDMYKEMDRKEKPIVDEQQIEENSLTLQGALKYKLEVKITYFVDHDFNNIEGRVKSIRNNTIYIEETKIHFADVIDVDFLNPLL